MSGGGTFDEGGAAGGPISCDIVQETVLQNPDATILKTIKKGQRLDVTMMGSSPVATRGDDIVGSIMYPGVAKLIRCMQEGYDYVAHVTKVVLGENECRVTIRPS